MAHANCADPDQTAPNEMPNTILGGKITKNISKC